MLRKFIIAVFFSTFIAGASLAGVNLDCGFFTAKVPGKDWETKDLETGAKAIVSPNSDIVLVVALEHGCDAKDVAGILAAAHGAETLVSIGNSDAAYEYIGTTGGKPMYAQVFSTGIGSVCCIAVIGNWRDAAATDVFNSITLKQIEAK